MKIIGQLNQQSRIRTLPSKASAGREAGFDASITLIGDSTLDNSLWVGGAERSMPRLGTDQDTPHHILAALTKQELKAQPILFNLAVDAWTTTEVLQGGYMNAAGMTRRTHPAARFHPLALVPMLNEHFKIPASDRYYVLSVGGNNFRCDFLDFFRDLIAKGDLNYFHVLLGRTPTQDLKEQIRVKMEVVLAKIIEEYKAILTEIRQRDPGAQIIIATQYYPDTSMFGQWPYHIYSAFAQIANAYGFSNSKQALHRVLHRLYHQVFSFIQAQKMQGISFVDMTHSMPSTGYHSHQIELNKAGSMRMGAILAQTIACLQETPAGNTPQYFRATGDKFIRNPLGAVVSDRELLYPSNLLPWTFGFAKQAPAPAFTTNLSIKSSKQSGKYKGKKFSMR